MGYTIEDARHKSYKFFPVKQPVTLIFETDNRTSQIIGYVESNDPNIFSDQEGTQISILCPQPYFESASVAEVVFSGVLSKFEFPFENNSLHEDLIEFGEIRQDTTQVIDYEGDAEVGFVITVHFLGPVSGLEIYNVDTRAMIKVDDSWIERLTGSTFVEADILTISTVKGDKYATLQRDGLLYNVFNAVTRESEWFYLTQGENTIAYMVEEGLVNLEFKLDHRVLWEGV